jgi:hypothetical protein
MSTLNNILSKIEKADKLNDVKLASHRMNLGAAEDIAKAKADLDGILKALPVESAKLKAADDNIAKAKVAAAKMITDSQSNADKAMAAANKYSDNVSKMLSKIGTTLDKIDKQAKDLGIDPKSIPGYSDVDKGYMAVDNANTALKTYSWQND